MPSDEDRQKAMNYLAQSKEEFEQADTEEQQRMEEAAAKIAPQDNSDDDSLLERSAKLHEIIVDAAAHMNLPISFTLGALESVKMDLMLSTVAMANEAEFLAQNQKEDTDEN